MQLSQMSPPAPHASCVVPGWQVPVESQHPAQFWVPHRDALPESAALAGALQTMIGSDGSTASGPQVSRGVKHSTDVAQSWMGPMGVDGHGPAWQFVVIVIAAQQTWPLGQTSALMHVRPPVVPPLLALPPLDDPLLLDTPLADPPLLDDEPVSRASIEPPLLVLFCPAPLAAGETPSTSRGLRLPHPMANARSTSRSSLCWLIARFSALLKLSAREDPGPRRPPQDVPVAAEIGLGRAERDPGVRALCSLSRRKTRIEESRASCRTAPTAAAPPSAR